MKEIRLSKSDKVAVIDDDDYALVSMYYWYCVKEKHSYYAVGHKRGQSTISIRMHRLIMNAPAGKMIDHVDCNGLNNQKANLRFASFAQNGWNRRPNKNSQYKGVYTCGDRYGAVLCMHNRKVRLGIFSTPSEAANAYNEAAIKYFGEFARLNEVVFLPLQYKIMSLT